jgi:hypothetical protein
MIYTNIYTFFQQISGNKSNLLLTENKFLEFLIKLKANMKHSSFYYNYSLDYLRFLFKMTAIVRDKQFGYGLRDVYYTLIYCWYIHYPELAFNLIRHNFKYSISSWNDGKYFCSFIKNKTHNDNHELINFVINEMMVQLKVDFSNLTLDPQKLSLLAKWIPREKSKYSWIFYKCAKLYFPYYIKEDLYPIQLIKAKRKCWSKFRKVCSTINAILDPIENIQCNSNNTEFKKINRLTGYNLVKYHKWVNKNVEMMQQNGIFENINLNQSKNDIFHKIIKLALEYVSLSSFNKDKEDYINNIWELINKTIEPLIDVLPIVESSIDMDENSLYKALGIAILIAEKTNIGNRIIISNINYFMINLEKCDNLVDKIKKIEPYLFRINSNLSETYKSICEIMHSDDESKQIINNVNILILSNLKNVTNKTKNCDNFLSQSFSFNKKSIKTIFWVFDGWEKNECAENISIINIGNIEMINYLWRKKNGSLPTILTSDILFLKYITKIMENEKIKMLDEYIIKYFCLTI